MPSAPKICLMLDSMIPPYFSITLIIQTIVLYVLKV